MFWHHRKPFARVHTVVLILIASICASLTAFGQDKNTDLRAQIDRYVELQGLLHKAARDQDWKKAIEYGEEMVTIKPEHGPTMYTLGTLYVIDGQTSQGLDWLEKAVDTGMIDDKDLQENENLKSIKRDREFKKLVAKAKKLRHERETSAEPSELKMYAPPDLDKTKPLATVVVLHGFWSFAGRELGVWKRAAGEGDFLLIAPQSSEETGDGGYGWTSVAQADTIVRKGIEQARKKYNIDDSRIVIAGFDQGGAMAYGVALKNPGKYVGAVLVCTRQVPDAKAKHFKAAKKAGTRFFFAAGKSDRMNAFTKAAHSEIESARLKTKLELFDSNGHSWPSKPRGLQLEAMNFMLDGRLGPGEGADKEGSKD